MKLLSCFLFLVMNVSGFCTCLDDPKLQVNEHVYYQVETFQCRHSLQCALCAESSLYYYLHNPIIVLMGGVSSGKSTLISNILQSLGADRRYVCEIPNGLVMANFVDFSIQKDKFFVLTFPENMRDFFQCSDSKEFLERTQKKLMTRFLPERASILLNRYRNREDFYYERLADLVLKKKIRGAIITTHTHSYNSLLKLKRAVATRFIRMPLYAFYSFVPLEELISRTKDRNSKVIQKVSPFYDIRFSWDVFYDFFRNLSTDDIQRTGSIVASINKLDTLKVLDDWNEQYLPHLLEQILRVYEAEDVEGFTKKKERLREYINKIFTDNDRVDLFFKGDKSIVIGSHNFVESSIKTILKQFVEKLQ